MRFLTGLRCVHRAAERLNLTGTGEPRIPARRHRWEAAPKVRFAQDSLLEGDGFELPVPREMTTIFEPSCFWLAFKIVRVPLEETDGPHLEREMLSQRLGI